MADIGQSSHGQHAVINIHILKRSWGLSALGVLSVMGSQAQLAKRALVKVLLSLAAKYLVTLTLNRDSADAAVRSGYKRILLKAHPDKGGETADVQMLQEAKERWEHEQSRQKQQKAHSQAPREHADPSIVVATKQQRKQYRIQTTAVMLTYNGIQDMEQWNRFLAFVKTRLKSWGVKHWCCTLEMSSRDSLHIHLYVQFHRQVDKTTQSFIFEGISPRADTNDYLGQGQGKRNAQQSMDRGFFYVFADKIGTQRDVDGTNVC